MKKPTLETPLHEFVSYHVRKRGCAKRHLIFAVDSFAKVIGRPLAVADLSEQTVKAYCAAGFGGLAPSTARQYLSHVTALWRHAAELGIVRPPSRNGGTGRVPDFRARAVGRQDTGGAMTLWELFDSVYRPARLHNATLRQRRGYTAAIKWLCYMLDHSATLGDLTTDTLCRFYGFCAERGLSPATVENHRQRIATLARFAFETGVIAKRVLIPRIAERDAEPAASVWSDEGSLAWFYAERYRPEMLVGVRPATIATYQAAVRSYIRYAGANLPIDRLDEAGIDGFEQWLRDRGCLSEGTVGRYPQIMRRMRELHRPSPPVNPEPPTLMRPAKPATDQSLRWFFEECYLREHPVKRSTEYTYRIAINNFSDHLGRDAMLSDLDPMTLNAFLAARQAKVSLRTVKGERMSLLTFWRSAHDWGYLEDLPRRIRKVKPAQVAPDAFAPQEVTALLAATKDERFDHEAKGVHVGRFLSAIIRTSYDTALRLGDLLRITRDELHEGGLIVLTMNKTGHVHTCQVRPSTLAALAAVALEDDERLLPWRQVRTGIHKYWRRLLRVAGLPVHRRNGLQKLRRTSASYVEAITPGAATGHLGHRSGDLARKHYLDPRLTSKAVLPPALPEPAGLLEWPKPDEPKDGVA
jgi:integrase